MCDIAKCNKKGKSYSLYFLNVEIVPTGNSDYSSTIEKEVKMKDFDLCAAHVKEYDKRMEDVLVFTSEKGLFFPEVEK